MRKSVAVMYALAVTWGASALARADDIVVFNTGVDSSGNVLAAGNDDPHWTITQVPATSSFVPGSAAKVATPHPVYLANDATGAAGSSWVGTASSVASSFPSGTYRYRTTFDLTGLDPSTAQLSGAFAVDDTVTSVEINGSAVAISGGNFFALTSFSVSTGFVEGMNTIEFVVNNAGTTPTGFRAVIAGTADSAVVPDTTPPVISGVADHSFAYTGSSVLLDAAALGITAVDDVDGAVSVTLSPSSAGLGTTVVTASAEDAAGNVATETFNVTVADTDAPVFTSLSVTPDKINKRNHKMVPFTVTAEVADTDGGTPVVAITSITSDEGNDPNDYKITGALTGEVRAERDGKGDGRTYTITVTATDAAGNSTTGTVEVFVPHDNGKKKGKCNGKNDDDDDDDDNKGGKGGKH